MITHYISLPQEDCENEHCTQLCTQTQRYLPQFCSRNITEVWVFLEDDLGNLSDSSQKQLGFCENETCGV